MRRLIFPIFLSVLLTLAGQTHGAGIEERMTPDTFQATGLHKLTRDELKRLDEWFQAHLSQTRTQAIQSASGLQEPPDEIRSRIDGEFTGWDGKSVFKLKNGQTWVQRTKGRWRHQASDPEVIIKRNFLGFFRMTLVEEGRSIGVKLKRAER